jgi:hypothetical protein
MRTLLAIALLAPACASAPTTTQQPTTLAHTVAQPSMQVAEVAAVDETMEMPQATSDLATPAPYALLFHEGQKWRFPVTLAMSSTGRPQQEQKIVSCEVQHIEYMCDRQISNIKCDDNNKVVGGSYTSNLQGMWRAGFANATNELDENTRAFERMPTANMHTFAYGKGWCSSDGGTMICVEDGKGLVGVQMLNEMGGQVTLGSVPQ